MYPPAFESDETFDALLPMSIRTLSEQHWTPIKVAKVAAIFLAADTNANIVDIGAGIGKFCLTGNAFTKANFTGIEQRKNFVEVSKKLATRLGLNRTKMIHGNFVDMDITGYTGIYFFNSFHENIVTSDSLDERVERSPELYKQYTDHLTAQLLAMPIGTRLATYWLAVTEIPGSYKLVGAQFDNLLKMWIKKS